MQENIIKNKKSEVAIAEEVALDFWIKSDTFKKSLEKEAPNGDYLFYDGPPFATGLPHYGHIVTSLIKDVVPRYWTMRGFRVPRRWGWDCHGLPIENIAEKELGINSKKEIEEKIGVAEFNETCRKKVLSYVADWKIIMSRLGRWVDMDNAYRTMDKEFMESVWWVFKTLWDKDLIYEGYRSMHVCPRCETTLSQAEVAEGYKMVKDLSVTAKFKILFDQKIGKSLAADDFTYILAWTTTPWTLVANVALAVNSKIKYALVESGERYILAYDKIKETFKGKEYNVIDEFKGEDLVGLKYTPIFDYYVNEELKYKENGWKIYHADFVNMDGGTGVVHIAPGFGEDDLRLGNEEKLPFIQHLGMNGVIKKEATDFAGLHVKPVLEEERLSTDIAIIRFLAKENLLFSKEKVEHSYPHCWRCDTPLLNYSTSSWFVSITKIKARMIELAKDINWSPEHIKAGRFGNWLEGARDWSISRQRYWASVIPLWVCECGEKKVIGSIKELEEISGKKVTDLHKHIVDKITFNCIKCNLEMHRILDVLDTWFDSGAMSFAQTHYPFENKDQFDHNFPAQFIGEGVDQTRCWFYYMHVIGTAIKDNISYENVIVNGIVLGEDGKKMSKKLKNYPDPSLVIDEFGADAVRYYLITSPVMLGEQISFSKDGVKEVLRNNVMLLSNVLKFFSMFNESNDHYTEALSSKSENILDRWILARLGELVTEVSLRMNSYNLPLASRPIEGFISDLSTWYLRRSRDRFKGDDMADKTNALNTMAYVLVEFSKVIAPFMPFMAEQIWQSVTLNNFKDSNKSVHLENWPVLEEDIDDKGKVVIKEMKNIRKIVELGLAARDQAGIRTRQPLSKIIINNVLVNSEFIALINDELNVKEVEVKGGEGDVSVELDLTITSELRQEGIVRELVRLINNLRKDANLSIYDKTDIFYKTDDLLIREAITWQAEKILKDTLSIKIIEYQFKKVELDIERTIEIVGAKILIGIKKIDSSIE